MCTKIDPKFRTKAGKLTRYSFACGYVEQKEIDANNRGTIEMQDGTYHVKGFCRGIHFYDAFAKVSDARKFLNTLIRKQNDEMGLSDGKTYLNGNKPA